MKILLNLIRKNKGMALLLTMIFTSLGILLLTAALNYTSNVSLLNERSNQYNTTMMAAEATTEKIISSMINDFKTYGQPGLANNLSSYRGMVPSSTESSYWTNFTFSDAQGNSSSTYVVTNGVTYFTNDLGSAYAGLGGTRIPYKVISNARMTTGRFNLTNAVQQEIAFTTIPIFQFAIFYNGLLEVTRAVDLNIRGRVHSNDSIYWGTHSSYTHNFFEAVSAVGVIDKVSRWDFTVADYTGPTTFYKGKTTNAPTMALPIGTNNSSAAVHKVIEQPPANEAISSAMGQERYYNKAEILILVSNATVTVSVKSPYSATSNNIAVAGWTNFMSTNLTFWDQREAKYQQVTEIDVAKFNTWATNTTNTTISGTLGSGVAPSLIYVADNRTRSGYGQAVRVVNGQTLPARGLTVASPNGLYVKGNYNCPNAALGTTNTTNTKPASFVADAVTILSPAWTDANSAVVYTSRDATNTTVNAAIISGNVKSQGADGDAPMSGGAHNLPRLLEDWGTRTLTINGSLCCLFESTRATGIFIHPTYTGQYYVPPTRNWSFDNNFLDPNKLPPGTPAVRILERLKWSNPPPNTTTYAGN
jgi:hypothetical protein